MTAEKTPTTILETGETVLAETFCGRLVPRTFAVRYEAKWVADMLAEAGVECKVFKPKGARLHYIRILAQ